MEAQISKKYLCVHGHFYQPPRENPWLEMIEYQKSAHPYHDWNERITRECYGPNIRSRLLGEEDRIIKLINNYKYMSFNFGPTLLSWLEEKHPWIYTEIQKADAASLLRYGGHGNAIAQVFNHIIMPLASYRDKLTQIRWGITDFRHRFGRNPEGMWLSETAVDLETLRLMAEEGIKFTILSPTQAQSVRPLEMNDEKKGKAFVSRAWQDVSSGQIDPTRPYRVILGREGSPFIDIFFYDGPVSRAIAYEKILTSGEDLLSRISQIFANHTDRPSLVGIATDGESYGHHFKFGEMALSWLFYHIEQDHEISLTNFGQFLELFPPEKEVKLFENSAWSCSHGIGRWKADCGCSVSHKPGWNQKWRAPLREGMDWLSSELSSVFESRAKKVFKDPWEARDDYIRIILNPLEREIEDFIRRHSKSPSSNKKVEILQLMESQRMALYMFTSCGWFFDDISGIEAAQVLMYASRAIELVEEWSSRDLEKEFMNFLIKAKSNDPKYEHGGKVYETLVKPSRITPSLAAAHHAMASFAGEPLSDNWPLHQITTSIQKTVLEENGIRGMIGEVKITEKRTGKVNQRAYLVLDQQGTEFYCIIGSIPENSLDQVADEIQQNLSEMSSEALVEVFSRNMNEIQHFFLKDLISDARKYIINILADNIDRRVRKSIGNHLEFMKHLIHILQETGEEPPPFIRRIFHILFFNEFYDLLTSYHEKTEIDLNDLTQWASLCEPSSCATLSKAPMVKSLLRWQIESFQKWKVRAFLDNIVNILTIIQKLDVELDLWEIQNVFYDLYQAPDFVNSLQDDVLTILNNVGRLLGFSIQEIENA